MMPNEVGQLSVCEMRARPGGIANRRELPSSPFPAGLALASRDALYSPVGPQAPLGVGRTVFLRRNPFRRGTAVFENSTACASTIDSRSWCASRFDPSTGALSVHGGGTKSQVGVVPRHGARPRCIGLVCRSTIVRLRAVGESKPMTARREVLHGEFDPGSGRTLAACLTHASGATNQGLPWGRAANG